VPIAEGIGIHRSSLRVLRSPPGALICLPSLVGATIIALTADSILYGATFIRLCLESQLIHRLGLLCTCATVSTGASSRSMTGCWLCARIKIPRSEGAHYSAAGSRVYR